MLLVLWNEKGSKGREEEEGDDDKTGDVWRAGGVRRRTRRMLKPAGYCLLSSFPSHPPHLPTCRYRREWLRSFTAQSSPPGYGSWMPSTARIS